MARDMVCKLCEADTEQEVAILLVSDLTGSGQLPIPIGPRCLPAWLTEMLEMFALAAPPEVEAELSDDDEASLEAYESRLGQAESAPEQLLTHKPTESELSPTATPKPAGRSRRTTFPAAAGNGSSAKSAKKETPSKTRS